MPRGPRFDAPGVIHHVTFRGIERREIFTDDADREALLRILDRLALTMLFRIFGWALMPNHVHLVVRIAEGSLPRFMARLLTSYGLYFNRRHARVGHLFQNRYWSRPIDEELETVVAYVHRNPARAGLTTDVALDRYRWCGHATVVGARAARLFEGDPYVCPDGLVGPALAAILEEECARAELSVAAVIGGARSRPHSAVRRCVVMRALRETGHALSEIGAALALSQSAVSQIARRVAHGGISSTNVPGGS